MPCNTHQMAIVDSVTSLHPIYSQSLYKLHKLCCKTVLWAILRFLHCVLEVHGCTMNKSQVWCFYSAHPRIGAKYCDECVCISAYARLSGCSRISKTTCPNFTKFSIHVELCAWLGSPLMTVAICYVQFFRFRGWRHFFTKWSTLYYKVDCKPYPLLCVWGYYCYWLFTLTLSTDHAFFHFMQINDLVIMVCVTWTICTIIINLLMYRQLSRLCVF